MGIGPMVYLDDPDVVNALITTAAGGHAASLGAPGKIGELRWHQHETFGWQVYRLTLNEVGALVVGEGVELASSDALLDSNKFAAARARVDVGTVLSEFGGVAQVAVADDFWFWALVQGEGLVIADSGGTGIVADTIVVTATDAGVGSFDDTGAGVAVGIALAAIAAGATGRVLITGVL